MNKKAFILNTIITLVLGVIAWKTSSGWVEIAGSVTGLLSVWLFARESMWNYPFSYANCLIWFYMFWQDKLYADSVLQLFFLVLTAYGNILWLKNKGIKNVRKTTSIRPLEVYMTFALTIVGTLAFGDYLRTIQDIAPYTDAFIATASVIAQYFLSKKVFENWYIWIILDVVQVWLYTVKGLNVTAFTYLIFLIIAIGGAISWKKVMKREKV